MHTAYSREETVGEEDNQVRVQPLLLNSLSIFLYTYIYARTMAHQATVNVFNRTMITVGVRVQTMFTVGVRSCTRVTFSV